MFNNRMLAVAAVLVMAVPAFGAAAPIVVGPVPEELVEGHTVFSVIQVFNQSKTNVSKFAAAVAVLVREYNQVEKAVRFPGVLWFNDQYLVSPYSDQVDDSALRYPCGGAVMAVNQGDPDPRMVTLSVDNDPTRNFDGEGGYVFTNTDTEDALTGYDYGSTDYANVNVDAADPTNSYSDATLDPATTVGIPFVGTLHAGASQFGVDYQKSYLVTDPNDHSWIVDKYIAYHRTGVAGTTQVYFFPVWVVNILGSPVFVPDAGLDCSPFYDVLTVNWCPSTPGQIAPVRNAVDPDGCLSEAEAAVETPLAPAQTDGQTTLPRDAYDSDAFCGYPAGVGGAYEDDPCGPLNGFNGYTEPAGSTGAGGDYCYAGQARAVGTTCDNKDLYPTRLYNAVLYFELQDLTVAGAPRDHGAASTDTNGCQEGTEWDCFNGDNAEGNSHPFNPTPHSGANTAEPCPYGGSAEPTNHGGSSAIGPYDASLGGHLGGSYCDRLHATREIDLYFSGAGRPLAPLVRNFALLDLDGSTEPFHGTGP